MRLELVPFIVYSNECNSIIIIPIEWVDNEVKEVEKERFSMRSQNKLLFKEDNNPSNCHVRFKKTIRFLYGY